MSGILPSRRSAVTPRRRTRSGRALFPGHARHFSAAQLAEIEARYAALLALAPTPQGDPAHGEETTIAIGQAAGAPRDWNTLSAQIAAWIDDDGRRTFVVEAHIADMPVELDPRAAHESAEALRQLADLYDSLGSHVEALNVIEAERR